MNQNKITPTSSGNILTSFVQGIRLGIANFWRNKFLSFATIIVMAVIIFIFNVILAIQFIGNQALQALSERVDIVIYLRDDISFYEAKGLSEALSSIEGVKKVQYTSKEEALKVVSKTHPKTADFLQKFNLKNPLPPSISVITANSEDHTKVQALLAEEPYKNLTQNYLPQGSSDDSKILSTVTDNLNNMSNFVRQLIFWMVLVFILGGTLIIVNAIQLTIFTRRHEIYIMRLVGATPNFIRLPFILEGILYGLCAVALSFLILTVLSKNILIPNTNLETYFTNLQFGKIFIAEIFISIFIGAISSFSAMEKYLKGKLTLN